MDNIFYIYSYLIYTLVELIIRRYSYPKKLTNLPNDTLAHWHKGEEWTLFVSPGYWLSRYYKNRIDKNHTNIRLSARRRFIWNCNKNNLIITVLFLFVFVVTYNMESKIKSTNLIGQFLLQLFYCLCIIRFISRSFEIAFAFIKDAIRRPQNNSGLNKYARITLSLKSYIEIYMLTPPAYIIFHVCKSLPDSLTLSLSVGSLTNIGYAFGADASINSNIVFIQVFTTLTLVVLSLAMYMSRAK